MKSFKIIITMMVLTMLVGVLGSNQTYAATSSLTKGTTEFICEDAGAKNTTNGAECKKAATLSTKIETVVKTLSGLVGAFAVGMIVYGGFKYITSQGDPRQAEAAKNIIWYAGVGLFIVLVAFVIMDLVIGAIK